ncbi:transposase [Legionella sp. CNM-1927-20]|uniref:transposase n=1 Tax=Legionella sp. CNM-1927-20 TaxID=3422221 RepID=UPI00403ADE7B
MANGWILAFIKPCLLNKKEIKELTKLQKEITKIEKEIASLVANHNQLNEQFKLLNTITGIGKLTAFRVLALMPDINAFKTAKQFAAYISITPKHHQSGYFVGRTTILRVCIKYGLKSIVCKITYF